MKAVTTWLALSEKAGGKMKAVTTWLALSEKARGDFIAWAKKGGRDATARKLAGFALEELPELHARTAELKTGAKALVQAMGSADSLDTSFEVTVALVKLVQALKED